MNESSPTKISKDVFVLRPSADLKIKPSSARTPMVILLFGWMDAQMPHLIKYIDKYREIYPAATQILIRSRQSVAWSSKRTNANALLPAVELLHDIGIFGQNPPDFLVHVFSNGGGFSLIWLSKLLHNDVRSKMSFDLPASRQPAVAIVLDSVPGGPELFSAIRAFSSPLPAFWMKVMATIPITLLWVFTMILSFVTRTPIPFTQLRNTLNQPSILPWVRMSTPRLYVYAAGDSIVEDHAVEAHVATAMQLGLNVRSEKFDNSRHVAHAKTNPSRYWGLIQLVWADAIEAVAQNN